jgi:hypothetical protein
MPLVVAWLGVAVAWLGVAESRMDTAVPDDIV